VAVERLTVGQAFHRTVQSAFLAGPAGASGFRERQWRLIRGRRGRVDLAVEADGDEQMLVIIEIKGTDWDAIPADRVMRNLRRHLRQLQAYLDTTIEDMEAGLWEGIAGALLYPGRPASADVGCLLLFGVTSGKRPTRAWRIGSGLFLIFGKAGARFRDCDQNRARASH
jgi:hypothetical protein